MAYGEQAQPGLKQDRHRLAVRPGTEMAFGADGIAAQRTSGTPSRYHFQCVVTERAHLFSCGDKTHGGYILLVRVNNAASL